MKQARSFARTSVIVGVTGGIAAYKTAQIVRNLIKEGADVRVIMTDAATRFVAPLTFSVLSGQPALVDIWDMPEKVNHISIAGEADLMLIAPMSATTMAKMAHGIADNLLTAVFLAAKCPVVAAPSMNENMLQNPATQANLELLKSRGVTIVDPDRGELACGTGTGRLADIEAILDASFAAMAGSRPLMGKKAIVTAGPTRESIDSVRFISNRSTGRMGVELAAALARSGAEVTLLCGPVAIDVPRDVVEKRFTSAKELNELLLDEYDDTDIVVMAAAVADMRPLEMTEGKIKKDNIPETIEFERTPDILSGLAKRKNDQILVGFALEDTKAIENAKKKLAEKKLDMIVVNSLDAMESTDSQVTMVYADGRTKDLPRQPKQSSAVDIVEAITAMVARGEGG